MQGAVNIFKENVAPYCTPELNNAANKQPNKYSYKEHTIPRDGIRRMTYEGESFHFI